MSISHSWRRGYDIGLCRWTVPGLCPIYGWQVAILWANCPLWVSQLRHLSLLSLWVG